MSHKVYVFAHADLAEVRACFSNPDKNIANGLPDATGTRRMFAHDWELHQPAAHAALMASGKVRAYNSRDAWKVTEGWVDQPFTG